MLSGSDGDERCAADVYGMLWPWPLRRLQGIWAAMMRLCKCHLFQHTAGCCGRGCSAYTLKLQRSPCASREHMIGHAILRGI